MAALNDFNVCYIYVCRKKSSSKNKNDFAVSANMAYGKVTLKPVVGGMDGGEYENPDKLLRNVQ